MPISFVETMRGWLRGADGPEIPVSFELVAVNRRRGRFDVRGLVSAPPLAYEAPARGTLDLGLGSLAYHLEFEGRDGTKLHLDATKHPTVLAPLRSMTRMQAEIHDGAGGLVASGEMRFALRDLPAFLATWLPGARHAHHHLDSRRRGAERRALTGPDEGEASGLEGSDRTARGTAT